MAGIQGQDQGYSGTKRRCTSVGVMKLFAAIQFWQLFPETYANSMNIDMKLNRGYSQPDAFD
jgi:hypothetical protein